ncbi:hypothetical protein FPRO04_09439 [Fusarium proliferatum]|nr:hypothetical protein FPRO04_09439 [Fusarium proliferatum]
MLLDELDLPLDDVVVVDRLAIADYNQSHILPQDEATLKRLHDWLKPTSPPLQLAIRSLISPPICLDFVDDLSLVELWHLVRLALKSMPRAYCVVDALDEMDGNALEGFLQLIDQLGNMHHERIKLIITSRPISTIRKIVRNLKLLDIRLDKKAIDPDISTYLEHRLDASKISPEARVSVKKTVFKKADGLFLYAKLAMDQISELQTESEAEISESIERMPISLSDMYRNLFSEHTDRTELPEGLQMLVLQLVTHATRPLRLLEISDCIRVTQPQYGQDTGTIKNYVRTCCGPLLEVLPDETVRVVHHSLTEYLFGLDRSPDDHEIPLFEPGPTHDLLANLCVSYLDSGHLDKIKFQDYGRVIEIVMSTNQDLPPFLNYAAVDDGNLDIVRLLVRHGAKLDEHDSRGCTPLHRALSGGARTKGNLRSAIVDCLLEAGADPWKTQEDSKKAPRLRLPIQEAFVVDDRTVPQLFLPSIKTQKQANKALSWVINGFKDLILMRSTLELGLAGINDHADSPTPLFQACKQVDPMMVSILLEAGADPNICQVRPKLRLLAESIKQRRALSGSRDEMGGPNVLHALAAPYCASKDPYSSYKRAPAFPNKYPPDDEAIRECFRLVINAGANVNHIDSAENTPLHLAEIPLMAQLLLEAGADITAINWRNDTPLHASQDIDIMKIILSQTDIDTRDRESKTMFYRLLERTCARGPKALSSLEGAMQLLDLGVDARSVDDDGNSALHYLASTEKVFASPEGIQLLERLMQDGVDPNLYNTKGEAAVHRLPIKGQTLLFSIIDRFYVSLEDLVKELSVECRFSLADMTKNTDTEKGESFISVMADLGARFDVTDKQGRTLLHAAVRNCRNGKDFDVLLRLIELGADPLQTDREGNTIWHEAMSKYANKALGSPSLETLQSITDLGIDPAKANNQGITPFHLFCEYKQPASNTILFEHLLQQLGDVNMRDNNGVTALHIGSTYSTDFTRRLLERGAEATLVTKEGVNVFHLASRGRQSNTIGLLLDCLRERTAKEELQNLLNLKDNCGRAPLYYACASGRFQSFDLLINAGAVVETETYEGSALSGCVCIEEETKNWQEFRSQTCSDSGAVLVDDTKRPKYAPVEGPLLETLDLIIGNAATPNWHLLDMALSEAAKLSMDEHLYPAEKHRLSYHPNHGYTVECLVQARKALGVGGEMPFSPTPEDLQPVLVNFAKDGMARLLDTLLTPETILGLGRTEYQSISSLMRAACESTEPNMPVIRLLVSKGLELGERKPPEYDFLHVLTRGGEHPWWHTGEALPYLIGQGVYLESRDAGGLTPLMASLGNIEKPVWTPKATEMLLRAGADPNSVDYEGKSCLARVIDNKTIFEMLIYHGAIVDPSLLTSAILSKDVGMVEMVLSSGADANVCRPSSPPCPDEERWRMYYKVDIPASFREIHPLDMVISEIDSETASEIDCEAYIRMVEILLKFGSNPNAPFHHTTVAHKTLRNAKFSLHVRNKNGANPRVTHSMRRKYLDLILQHPIHDVDLRDTAGVPLLHVAFEKADEKSARTLIDRGADLYARDDFDRNIFHIGSTLLSKKALFDYIIVRAPELLDQVDKCGRPPLHHALDDRNEFGYLSSLEKVEEFVQMLIAAGANILEWKLLVDDRGGEVWQGSVYPTMELLLSKGADINARNQMGETPIFSFFREGDLYVDMPRTDSNKGFPAPFRYTSKSERQAMEERRPVPWALFEKAGVDWTAINANGQSLLHLVASHRGQGSCFTRLERFKLLVGKGLDPLVEDQEHRTALDIAAANGAYDIMELFKI